MLPLDDAMAWGIQRLGSVGQRGTLCLSFLLLYTVCVCRYFLQGKIKFEEHVTEGFDNMFDAFTGLFRGDNMGKTVVKAWTL